VTKPDLYPLPTIADLLDQLGKSKYFSTLNLKSGYWQIKLIVLVRKRLLLVQIKDYLSLAFGVTNAPAVFHG